MQRILNNHKGFTLAEVIITVIIAGILGSLALRSVLVVSETAKIEQTKTELNQIVFAIVGNPELENNGVRSDFGYVGDVGTMPANLDALHSNPGGYATWKGPYIENRFSQITTDYNADAWGVGYSYSGVSISSSGSGSTIVKQVANGTDDILINRVSGNIYDADGTPPGSVFKDSLSVNLTIPNGAGAYTTKTTSPDMGGYFSFDSIPIGNHDIDIIYSPSDDTLNRFASVIPNSNVYEEYYFGANLWYSTSGGGGGGIGITLVPNSDSLRTNPNCNNVYYWIENTSGSDIVVTSMSLTWSSPTAYYAKIEWDGISVYNGGSSDKGSGDIAIFSTPQTFYNGTQIKISHLLFRANPGGGSPANMDNTDFIVTFSDGSSFNLTADLCTN
ncbi:type II secretion system protein [Candidatus Zixiibacteriota bacterium]